MTVTGRSQSPCGCQWTPGIDLPTTECVEHAADPTLAHRGRQQTLPCPMCGGTVQRLPAIDCASGGQCTHACGDCGQHFAEESDYARSADAAAATDAARSQS